MQCRIRGLRRKEVINICDGCRLGFVSDVDIKVPEGQVLALVVSGPGLFFGLFGRGEEFYVPWDCIQRIGDRKELDVRGAHISPHTYPFVIENMTSGRLKTGGVVTRTFPLDQWEEAFRCASGEEGDIKVAFRF